MEWFKRSPWVLHYNATSCNGCDTEVIVSLTPLYDLERFGIITTGEACRHPPGHRLSQ
jgi:ech hydrogenase subunit C